MRFRISTWVLLCTLVGVGFGCFGRNWSPTPKNFISEPIWVLPFADDSDIQELDEILASPAPLVPREMKLRDLEQILARYIPTRFDELALEEERISMDDRVWIPMDTVSAQPSLHSWLVTLLEPYGMTYTLQHGILVLTTSCNRNALVKRIYPHPKLSHREVVDSIISLVNAENWDIAGGVNVIRLIETDSQSLLAVSCDFVTHRELEKFLAPLYRCSGMGWHQEARPWTRLPQVCLNRLAVWIDPDENSNSATTKAALPTLPTFTPVNAWGGTGCGGF